MLETAAGRRPVEIDSALGALGIGPCRPADRELAYGDNDVLAGLDLKLAQVPGVESKAVFEAELAKTFHLRAQVDSAVSESSGLGDQ